ncbi:unnamed protein product [Arabidopsis halleri]
MLIVLIEAHNQQGGEECSKNVFQELVNVLVFVQSEKKIKK